MFDEFFENNSKSKVIRNRIIYQRIRNYNLYIMKNRKKSIEKLIKENFSKKDNFDDEVHEEDNLVKRATEDLLDDDVEEFPADDAFSNFNVFKSKSFPADSILSSKTYKGKNISRKSFEGDSEIEDKDDESLSDFSESSEKNNVSKKTKRVTFAEPSSEEDEVESEDDDAELDEENEEDSDISNKDDVDEDNDDVDEENEESDEEGSEEDGMDGESDIEDDISDTEGVDASFMYSKAARDESADKEKGEAVRTQLNLCDSLLESRITLQKALFAANQLPKPSKYEEIWTEFSEDEKNTVIQCRESVWDLLENFIRIQSKFRQKCPEFLDTLNESAKKEYEEQENAEPKIKRRKIAEYPAILDKMYNQYKPYRNAVIQKWNDRTKVASGKLAKTNFSAFDVPIVKQIEQIFEDKHRLIEKTQVKRADYKIIGDEEIVEDDEKTKSSSTDHDDEIFDDDDFYHKLLRDYIERKTADVSDPTQLGRKWIKLQSLRSKMKRKIDTRCTKGRKIKFDVHPKLVNFMAPIANNQLTDTAVNELYNSIFGNKFTKS